MSNKCYKSSYDFGRLSRYNSNSSIADILSEDIYLGLKDTKDNIAKTASKLYDGTISVLVNDKVKRYKFITVSATLLGGLTFAAFFNYLGADAAHAREYIAEKISSHSFKLETIAHAGFAFVTFMSLSVPRYMKQGNSFWKSAKLSGIDLAVLTSVAAPLSLIGYNYLREISVTNDIVNGVDPRWAVLKAQIKLAAPYYVSVIASHKLMRYFITDRLGITNGFSKVEMGAKDRLSSKEITTAKIVSEKEIITNTIDDVVDVA